MKLEHEKKIIFFLTKIVFFVTLFFMNLSAGSLGGASGYFAFQPVHNVFYDREFARGFVRMTNGFTVTKKASGPQSTHGSMVFMDTTVSVSGAIDLRDTNTIYLQSDLILDNGATFSSGGTIFGYDRAIILNGDLEIPDGGIIHTSGRVTIDGQGHTLTLGNSAQLFIDTDATLTLRNLTLKNTKNFPGKPSVQCAAFGSKLCLDDVELALADDFYFNCGQFFIHNDVAITGTSAFVYRSPRPSFIASDSNLYFDVGTTFSVAPATFTDCPYTVNSTYTTNNFILMADQTSALHLNGCNFFTTLTGLRITKGAMVFDNSVNVRSNASFDLATTYTTPVAFIGSAPTTSSAISVSFSPDGKFIAVVSFAGNRLQIFRINENGYPIQVTTGSGVATASGPYRVSWSPDGRFLAVVTTVVSNKLQIFRFYGAGNPVKVTTGSDVDTGAFPYGLAWSPDGRFIAVANNSDSTLQVFRFNGSGNPVQVTTGLGVATGSGPQSVSWSPDGRFIAVVNFTGNTLQIFRFYGVGNPVQVTTGSGIATGSGVLSAEWSPDGRFLAVSHNSGTLKIFRFYGSGNPVQVTVGTGAVTGSTTDCVKWSWDGRFIAAVNRTSNTLQIFRFYGTGNPVQLTTGLGISTGSGPRSVAWSPDGKFMVVVNTNDSTLQVFRINYIVDRSPQSLSNSIVFGNSALGENYDLNVRGLAGAQVNVDGIINYDCLS